jgi:hypothetical protein
MYPDSVLVNVSLISPEYRASYLKQAMTSHLILHLYYRRSHKSHP